MADKDQEKFWKVRRARAAAHARRVLATRKQEPKRKPKKPGNGK